MPPPSPLPSPLPSPPLLPFRALIRPFILALLCGLASLAPVSAPAYAYAYAQASASARNDLDNNSLRTELLQLRAQDDYLQRIGWRLKTGNTRSCINSQPAIGLLLEDAGAYPDAVAVRQALGQERDIFVQSAVESGPAYRAGIRAGAEIISINGAAISSFAPTPAKKWQRMADIRAFIAASLASSGGVQMMLSGQSQPLTITGISTCPARFELHTKKDTASANSERVAIGTEFVGLSYPEDEFAAALAHELAHVILRHPQWLDANGRERKNIRATEREADRLMPWLLANAGYSFDAAGRFMRRWGPRHDGGVFRKRTHDGWDERARLIEAEYPLIEAALAAHDYADWQARFPIRQTTG